jgi:hypothetical protein
MQGTFQRVNVAYEAFFSEPSPCTMVVVVKLLRNGTSNEGHKQPRRK